MRRNAVPLVRMILFMLSVGSVFTAAPASAQTPLPITIGYQSSSADDWLLYVARDLKLFEKVGLAPTYVPFDASPPMITAAQSKSIDVTMIKVVPFLIGLSQGVDWAIIGIYAEGAFSEGIVARQDSGIDTLVDLRGKRIGYYKGSSAHYGIMMALRQIGIRLDQVTLLDMSPEEQMVAMKNKDIDAVITWEPWIQKMLHDANAKLITTEGDLGIYSNVVGITARRDWLRDNRETAVRLVRALLMAYDIVQKDPDIGINELAEDMGLSTAAAKKIYRDSPPPNVYWWTDRGYRYSLVEDAGFHRRLGFLAKFLLEQKLIAHEVDVGDALDASVVTEALKTWKTSQ
jgi:ABC-type nitrate/sulfonate/bicarbonate transport system substrate-binding protein